VFRGVCCISELCAAGWDRKFTFGAQNENEVVFVPGKSGRIEFLFTELYGAKKIK